MHKEIQYSATNILSRFVKATIVLGSLVTVSFLMIGIVYLVAKGL